MLWNYDKGEKFIPVGYFFCEIGKGRTRLRIVFRGGRSCTRGRDEDEGVAFSSSLVTLLFPLNDGD